MCYFYLQIRLILQDSLSGGTCICMVSYQLDYRCWAYQSTAKTSKEVVPQMFQMDAAEFCEKPLTNQY